MYERITGLIVRLRYCYHKGNPDKPGTESMKREITNFVLKALFNAIWRSDWNPSESALSCGGSNGSVSMTGPWAGDGGERGFSDADTSASGTFFSIRSAHSDSLKPYIVIIDSKIAQPPPYM